MATNNPILNQAAQAQAVPDAATTEDVDAKLAAVTDALTTSGERIAVNIGALQQGQKQTKTATDVATQAIGDIAAASQTISLASGTANLQAQNATIESFIASGGHDAQVALSSELAGQEDRLSDLLAEKTDIVNDEFTGVAFIDEVINEFRSAGVDAEIEAVQAERDQTARQIASSGAVTETHARQNALVKKTLNDGTIQANQEITAAKAILAGSEMEIKNINANAGAMSRLLAADQRNVSNLMAVWRAEGEQEDRDFKRVRHEFAVDEMALSREKWEFELPTVKVNLESAQLRLATAQTTNPTDIKAAIANNQAAVKRFNDLLLTEETIVDQIQKGQSLGGVNIEDRETILFGLRQTGRTKDKYIRLQELGGVPDPIMGLTPFEAQNNSLVVDPTGTSTPTKASKLLDDTAKLQVEKYKEAGDIPKDEETIKADFNTTAKELATSAAKEIRQGDETNPYLAPPMSVLSQKASVLNSTLYKRVLEPLNLQETNPQIIVNRTVAGISAGTITPEEGAAGIEAIFEAAAAHNNTESGGFRRYGLPNQTTYNAQLASIPTSFDLLKGTLTSVFNPATAGKLAVAGISGETGEALGEFATSVLASSVRTFTTDLMNEAQVKQMLVKMLSSQPDKPATDEEK